MIKRPLAAPLCLASLLLISACSSYKTVELGDNVKAYQIICSGLPFSSNQDCYDRANYICGDGGYTIIKENDPSYPHSQNFWDLTTHDALIRCNVPNEQSQPNNVPAHPGPQP